MVAIVSAIVYLVLRPPIYDSDGYRDLLSALGPSPADNIDPLHLLSVPIQIGVTAMVGAHPYPPVWPFQILGIALNCFTLFVFGTLLLRIGASTVFVLAASAFVALSPRFWYVAFQNKPYPLICLALVLFLWTWATPDGHAPKGLRLAANGLCLAAAILIHQAAVFLAAATAPALILYTDGAYLRRIRRAVIWGLSTCALVLAVYLWGWYSATGGDPGFLSWTRENLAVNGPLVFRFPFSLIQAMIGISGAIVNDVSFRIWLEESLSPRAIQAIYAALGTLGCVVLGGIIWFRGLGEAIVRTLRTNPLAGLCVLTILAWSAIVIAWEPVTSNHWVPVLFPALVLIALGCGDKRLPVIAFASVVLPLSALNLYLNHLMDTDGARSSPEVLAAAIDHNLAKNDIFVVLANEDWYGDVEYEMLFRYLRAGSDERGVAILNDFVLPAKGSPGWSEALSAKISSTLKAGGNVFIAQHVLDPKTYADLGNIKGAYAPKEDLLQGQYADLNGSALFQELQKLLRPYQLRPSGLQLGDERFFVVEPMERPSPS